MNQKYKTITIVAVIFILLFGAGLVYYDFVLHKESPSASNGSQVITPADKVNFKRDGNIVKNNPGLKPDTWYLIYEQPGQPAIQAELKFTEETVCNIGDQYSFCPDRLHNQGEPVFIEGYESGGVVAVKELTALSDIEPPIHTNIRLFYYNEDKDKELSGSDNVLCSQDAILPVVREMHVSRTPIQDTIKLLIKGELTLAEKAAGFTTEFPHEGFNLLSTDLKNSVLTLEFTEVQGFTSGGSCRISILANQIIKTAEQFLEVKEVKFKPEELFQP